MASRVLRQAVLAALMGDPDLAAAGLTEETISPAFSPDGPNGDLFLVLRWGATVKGIGTVNQVSLQCWAYNRQPDYGPIIDVLTAVKDRLASLAGVVMAPGESVLAVDYGGDSEDQFDPGYRAYTRWCSHTITASGS